MGRMAIKLFSKYGIKTIAIVHEKELVEEIKSLGATHTFYDAEENIGEKLV